MTPCMMGLRLVISLLGMCFGYQAVYAMHATVNLCKLRKDKRSITERTSERGCAGELLGLGKV
jgi:hypothetical protein